MPCGRMFPDLVSLGSGLFVVAFFPMYYFLASRKHSEKQLCWKKFKSTIISQYKPPGKIQPHTQVSNKVLKTSRVRGDWCLVFEILDEMCI